jgi:2-keto-4-pentenoate hydratase
MAVDPRLVAALRKQLARRDRALAEGAARVGWKLGVGRAERLGDGPVLGYLTSSTLLQTGSCLDASGTGALHADLELAVEFDRDVTSPEQVGDAIAGYAVALELVDLSHSDAPADSIVAGNVFHRAVVLGPTVPAAGDFGGHLTVDGERETAAAEPVLPRLRAAVDVLAAVGEQFRAGDRIITGSIIQRPVRPGAEVVAELPALGAVSIRVAGDAPA